jgi:hypothetical protein
MKVDDLLKKLSSIKNRVALCDEVFHHLENIRAGTVEAVGTHSDQGIDSELDELKKYIDEYRLLALSEIAKIKRIEVPVGKGNRVRKKRSAANGKGSN